MTKDQEWEGPLHTLIVHSAEPPLAKFGDWELEYEIVHPESCQQIEAGWEGHTFMTYDCALAWTEGDIGLSYALEYSHTLVTKPGTYQIYAWGNAKHYLEGIEYDAGIAVANWPTD